MEKGGCERGEKTRKKEGVDGGGGRGWDKEGRERAGIRGGPK
jgi:hypothetical protein